MFTLAFAFPNARDPSARYDIRNNFFFEADAWKMDYGGHDSRFTGNVVYHGHNDGQNCVNTWPFLPGHGAVYSGNKCILPRSLNLGNVGDGIVMGCSCPGDPSKLMPYDPIYTTDTWRAECGIDFSRNEYYTFNVSGTTVNCNCTENDPDFPGSCGRDKVTQPSFATWQHGFGNDVGSTLSTLPTDEELIRWAREKLGMKPHPLGASSQHTTTSHADNAAQGEPPLSWRRLALDRENSHEQDVIRGSFGESCPALLLVSCERTPPTTKHDWMEGTRAYYSITHN
jgi:hypothetical protein